jgi:hypothetical protein
MHVLEAPLKKIQNSGSAEKIAYFWERDVLISYAKKIPVWKEDDEEAKKEAKVRFDEAVKNYSPTHQKLILDMIGNLDRTAARLKKLGVLSDEEIKMQRATMEEIEKRLNAIKTAYLKEIENNRKDRESPIKLEISETKPLDGVEFILPIKGKISTNIQLNKAPDFKKNKSQFKPIETLDITKPEKVKDTLASWVNSSPNSADFQDMLACLPIPGSSQDKDFWNKLPEDDIEESMHLLNKLMLLLGNTVDHTNKKKHSPEATIVLYGFFSILDFLARRADKNGFLKESKVSHWDLIFELQKSDFLLKKSISQKKLKEILAYFDPDWSLDQHFSEDEIDEKRSKALFSHSKYEQFFGGIVSRKWMTLELSEKDPTFRFYKKLLKEEDVRSELEARGAFSVPEDLNKPMRILLSNIDQLVSIPDSIKLLHQACFNCSCFSNYQEQFFTNDEVIKSKKILFSCLFQQFENDKEVEKQKKINLLSVKELNNITDLKISKSSRNAGIIDFFDTYPGSSNLRDVLDEYGDFNLSYMVKEFKGDDEARVKQNDLIYKSFFIDIHDDKAQRRDYRNDRKKLSKEESNKQEQIELELRMLGADPFDEAQRTLSFIETYPEVLGRTYVQFLVEMHLFKPLRLDSQLEDSPDFANQVAQSIEKAFKYHKEQGDAETALFLISLANQLKEHIAEKGIKIPDFMLNLSESLLELARDKKTNYKDAIKCYETLILLHSSYREDQFKEMIENYNQDSKAKREVLESIVLAHYCKLTLGINKSPDSVNIEDSKGKDLSILQKVIPLFSE